MEKPVKYTENDVWHRTQRSYTCAAATNVTETWKRFCAKCNPRNRNLTWVCMDCMRSSKVRQ